jgi:hypothetical protein
MAALVIIAIAVLFFYWVLKIGGMLDSKSNQSNQPSRPTPTYSPHTIRYTPKSQNITSDNPKGCNEYLDNPFGSDGKEYGLVGMQYLHLENKDYGVNYGVAFAETDNKYDKYAISIRYSANEKTVAYLPRENKELHEYILSVGGQTSAAFKIWTIDGIKIHGLAYVEVKPYTTKKELEGYEISDITEQLLNYIYESHDRFSEGFAGVRRGRFWGFVNLGLSEVVTPEYDYVGDVTEGFAIIRKEDRYGFLKMVGCSYPSNWADIQYDYAYSFSNERARVKKDNLYGYVGNTYDTKEAIPLKYEDAYDFDKTYPYAVVKESGKYGMIDKLGNWVVKPIFDQYLTSTKYNGSKAYNALIGDRLYYLYRDGRYEEVAQY